MKRVCLFRGRLHLCGGVIAHLQREARSRHIHSVPRRFATNEAKCFSMIQFYLRAGNVKRCCVCVLSAGTENSYHRIIVFCWHKRGIERENCLVGSYQGNDSCFLHRLGNTDHSKERFTHFFIHKPGNVYSAMANSFTSCPIVDGGRPCRQRLPTVMIIGKVSQQYSGYVWCLFVVGFHKLVVRV